MISLFQLLIHNELKLNTKIRYGVRAMLEIALTDPLLGTFQKDIAINQDISNRYLDHIIAALKTSGLITTFRGRKSGYILTRKPSEISLYDIYKAFEPDINIVDCIAISHHCERELKCATLRPWTELNDIITNYLKNKSLEELLQIHKEINP